MEEVGAARGIVARQRVDLRLNLRRRLGHDVEGVPGAHGWECSMVWGEAGGRFFLQLVRTPIKEPAMFPWLAQVFAQNITADAESSEPDGSAPKA